jgi:hypothetical protein
MKKNLIIFGLLLVVAGFTVAEPLGITVGTDLSFGDILADNYQFAGKADPVFGILPGQGSIKPYIMYTRVFGAFMLNSMLSNKFGLNDPQTNKLEFDVLGMYTLAFNENRSMVSFSLDNLFKLQSLDWSIRGEDGAPGWSDVITPGIKYTHAFGFGSAYAKLGLPVSFTNHPYVNYLINLMGILNPEDYRKPFIFAIPEIGINTAIGLGFFTMMNIQIFPDRKRTPIAPAYDKFAADTALEQLTFVLSYTRAWFTGSLLLDFPISGTTMNTHGIKDQGFAITPTLIFTVHENMRLTLSAEILNIGKNTGITAVDKVSISPIIGFSYGF